MVICGRCSIHDTKAAREYAGLLKGAIDELSPTCAWSCASISRSRAPLVGWKGLLNDPYLDQSYKINDGLRLARHLLLDLAEMGVPAGNRISGHDFAAVRGRSGELGRDWRAHHGKPGPPATVLRLSCPVGFKNATSGDAQIAVEAIVSAAQPHAFLGHTKMGSRPFLSPREIRIPM